jgi:MFS transporter, ACS family, allantoate permease
MCLGAVHSFGGLGAVRFFLGFAEGSVQPAFIIITSHRYKRREHPIRVATWVSMSDVSQILGVLIMYAIGNRDMAIASWRVLFFVIGGMTCVCGIGFILLMPRNPSSSTSASANSLPSASPSIVLPETGPNSTMLS